MKDLWPLGLFLVACGASTPSDDPADFFVDTNRKYTLTASDPVTSTAARFVVPSSRLPAQAVTQTSNNNVEIIFHEGRLYMGFRTAPQHFASEKTQMHVVSSADEGRTWKFEHTIAMGSDVREPRFMSLKGVLSMYFFQAGTSAVSFEPKFMWRTERDSKTGRWSELEQVGEPGQIPWSIKTRGGKAYFTSYSGNHYGLGASNLGVFFWRSSDGRTFEPSPVDTVYRGGVSEVAFEFTANGDLWAVTRNEDGDSSGFGTAVCFAAASNLWAWDCPAKGLKEIYESPAMFRHGDDIYLIARRDIGGPFDMERTDLSDDQKRLYYQQQFSLRPKRTSVYRLLKEERDVEYLFDLPGCGDTAFPSVRRKDAHTFLVANYTSPLDAQDYTWLDGQRSERGTSIYFTTLTFK